MGPGRAVIEVTVFTSRQESAGRSCSSRWWAGTGRKIPYRVLREAYFFKLDPCNVGPMEPKDPAPEEQGHAVLRSSSSCLASEADNPSHSFIPAPFAPSIRLRHLFPAHSFITPLPSLILLPGDVICLHTLPSPVIESRALAPILPHLQLPSQMATLCHSTRLSHTLAPKAANPLPGQL